MVFFEPVLSLRTEAVEALMAGEAAALDPADEDMLVEKDPN